MKLNELLSESDVISLHVPLSPQTHHLIGKEQFGLMKPSAMLINTSRGPVIDETALYEALSNKNIWGQPLTFTRMKQGYQTILPGGK